MPSLTEEEIGKLTIDSFIFHVVHHGAASPVLLDEAPIGTFERFFLDRVVETLKGNRYTFTVDSLTYKSLVDVRKNPKHFVDASKTLAVQFHSHGDQRIKHGVLIVMALRSGSRSFFSLIKYDHEKVVSFQVKNAQAVLQDVVNSFTESPQALQKSALIELSGQSGDLVVIDRNKRSGITTFFQNFLGVERLHTDTDLTHDAIKVVIKTVMVHASDLPPEITTRVTTLVRTIAKKRKIFNADEFFTDFFGVHGTPEIRATFDNQLQKRAISGEAFSYDEAVLPSTGPKKYKTSEGIVVTVPEAAASTVEIKNLKDGASVVTIRTQRLVEQ